MDSDPEPRSASPATSLASAQGDDTPEEPPSPFQSAAFLLGPLIAVLTLAVPLGSVIADRAEIPASPSHSARPALVNGGSTEAGPLTSPSAANSSEPTAEAVSASAATPGLAPASAAGRPGP